MVGKTKGTIHELSAISYQLKAMDIALWFCSRLSNRTTGKTGQDTSILSLLIQRDPRLLVARQSH
jgi:hypothetical protein